MLLRKDALPYNPAMTNHVYTAIPEGFDSRLITVESDANHGLPNFNIIGMPSRSISESRDRIRSAIRNSGFTFPNSQKITVNLAPADCFKTGSSLDLPIALSVLTLSQQLLQNDLNNRLFVGELSLDGSIKAVKGILNIIECAKKFHFKQLFIPAQNSEQASLIADSSIAIFPIHNLRELWLLLKKTSAYFTPIKKCKNYTKR